MSVLETESSKLPNGYLTEGTPHPRSLCKFRSASAFSKLVFLTHTGFRVEFESRSNCVTTRIRRSSAATEPITARDELELKTCYPCNYCSNLTSCRCLYLYSEQSTSVYQILVLEGRSVVRWWRGGGYWSILRSNRPSEFRQFFGRVL